MIKQPLIRLGISVLTVISIVTQGCKKEPSDAVQAPDDTRYPAHEVFGRTIEAVSAVDALGRKVLSSSNRSKQKRDVGLFYFAWLGQHPTEQRGIFDISDLLQNNPSALFSHEGTAESPIGQYHFWGEPLFGYYNSADPWVITRHIELFTFAGIDYLVIDATNGFYYEQVLLVLLEQLLHFQQQGWDVPKVAFYTNSQSGRTTSAIYDRFYQNSGYASLWYKPNGRPFIVGITENNQQASDQTRFGDFDDFISISMKSYFDVRESQWPTGLFNESAFPWISWEYPQRLQNSVLSVSVAQHSPVNIVFSDTVYTKGRGYDALADHNEKTGIRAGINFQQQWETVFANLGSVSNVFLTGWNEWIAIKNTDGENVFFVDGYNEEFSRDIELMKGGYGDNFYLQMLANIKRFKYDPQTSLGLETATIDIYHEDVSQWESAKFHVKDFQDDAIPRSFGDFSGLEYHLDHSARNDITDIIVAHDHAFLYMMVQTTDPITDYNGTDENWMNILIRTGDGVGGFFGFEYLVNRQPKPDGATSVERSTDGYQWTEVDGAPMHVFNNIMQIAIPLESIGQTADSIKVHFKVADNVTEYEDIMDYYVSGDSAPIGRLSYFYSN